MMKLRQSKKLTALLLTAAMAVTMLPTVALADDAMTDITNTGLDLYELAKANTPQTTYKAGGGTVTYIPATETEPTTLILDNAEIKGSGELYEPDSSTTLFNPAFKIDTSADTNIKLVGESHIEGCYAALLSSSETPYKGGKVTVSGSIDKDGKQSGSLITEKCQFFACVKGNIILDAAHVEYINGQGFQIGIFELGIATLKNKTYFKAVGQVGIQESSIIIDDSTVDIDANGSGIFREGSFYTGESNADRKVSITNSTVNINQNGGSSATGITNRDTPFVIENSQITISNVKVGINHPKDTERETTDNDALQIKGNSKLNINKADMDSIRASFGVVFTDTSDSTLQAAQNVFNKTPSVAMRNQAKIACSGTEAISASECSADFSGYASDAMVLTNTEPTAEGAAESGKDTALNTVKYFRAYPIYPITAEDTENGEISVSAEKAAVNDTITLTVKPDEGYLLNELKIMAGDEEIKYTENEDGTYSFTMPAKAVTVKTTFKSRRWNESFDSCENGDNCPLHKFADVDAKKWYHEGVHFCLDNGIMQGTDKGFEPQVITTRAMITTMLWRLDGEPKASYNMTFKDVQDGQWYTEAIRWAQSTGIVNGYDNNTFGTNDGMTREQVVTVMYRYAKYKGYDVSAAADLSKFADADSVSSWAADAVKWAVDTGIIVGDTRNDGRIIVLDPQGSSTRAQAATMLMRYCTTILK